MVQKKSKEISSLLIGLILTAVITGVFLLMLAFIMLKTDLSSEVMENCILGVYVTACFCGGFYYGKKSGKRRFLRGMVLGAVYFLILFLISGLGDREVQSDLLQRSLAFILCTVGGMCGGMLAG